MIHHRVKLISLSNTIFTLGHENVIQTVESCKYLGLIIDSHRLILKTGLIHNYLGQEHVS